MITKNELLEAQNEWGNGIVKIGQLQNNRTDCEKFTNEMIDRLYAFEKGEVLFKPTKAAKKPFRLNKEAALSYFIGGNDEYSEDKGFALQPWTKVRFENASIILEENRAIAMGHYFFTDKNGDETKVEYTFAYQKNGDRLKIDLHHSSIPFQS